MKCNQCDSATINGVFCHEHGCPNAWQDIAVPCFECGFDFHPDKRWQVICSDCQEAEFYGLMGEDEEAGC